MKYAKQTFVADVNAHDTVIHFKTSSIRETGEVEKIMAELDEVLTGFAAERVILNFRGVNMMCSSFLGRLIGLNRKLRDLRVALSVCGLDPEVERAFKLLRLHKLIKVHPTLEKALK